MGPKARVIKFYSGVSDRSEVVHLISRLFSSDGGPGSGNFGHAGRPNKVGGSAPSGSGGSGINEPSEKNKEFTGLSVKTVNSIGKKAQTHRNDYSEWVYSLTVDETDALENQYHKTHKEETDQEREGVNQYFKRIWMMLASEAKEPDVKNTPVSGKDISESYEWNATPYTEGQFGQVIDTQIEDIMAKQGFNGVPKVVTKEELDGMIEKNPELPIMYRTFSAPDEKTLEQYNKDLEKGAWYVDCGIGGSKYGQGMYTAAALPWNEKELDSIYKDGIFRNDLNGKVVKNAIVGEVYQLEYDGYPYEEKFDSAKEGESFALHTDDPDFTIVVTKDKNGRFYERDNPRKVWEAKDLSENFEYMCNVTVMDKDRLGKRDANVPLEQMRFYIRLNENREKRHSGKQELGGEHLSWEVPSKYYYNGRALAPDGMTRPFDENEMEAGKEYIVSYNTDGDGSHSREMLVVKNKSGELREVLSTSGKGSYDIEDHKKEKFNWMVPAKEVSLNPPTTTRRMTLDPSSKIVPFEKLSDEFKEYKYETMSGAFADKARERYFERKKFSDEQKNVALSALSRFNNYTWEHERDQDDGWKKAVEYFGGKDKLTRICTSLNAEVMRSINNRISDVGAYAAAKGYDAIACSNYGRTIVVLNRTKLIISDERVEVPREEVS